MARDKPEKGPRTRAQARREEAKQKKKRGADSDSDPEGDSEEGEELNMAEYHEFLSKLFPSKHMDEKVRAHRRKKKRKHNPRAGTEEEEVEVEEDEGDDEDEDDEDWTPSGEEEDDGSSSYSSEEELDSEDEAALAEAMGNARFNIIFTMGRPVDSEDETDEEEEEDEEDEEEEDDGSAEEEEEKRGSKKRRRRSRSKGAVQPDQDSSAAAKEEAVIAKLKSVFDGLSEEEKKAGIVQDLLKEYETLREEKAQAAAKLERKEKAKNAATFKKLLREKDVMNDARFFKEKLSPTEQKSVLAQMKEVREHCDVVKPYRLTLLDANIPVAFKACAYKKISTLRYMEPGGGEYYKIKTWVDAFMRIPFNVHRNLPLSVDDGVEKCHEFMENAKKTLDEAVYGLDDAKLQIMQMVGQWLTNPSAVGSAIAIQGPMGTGKTTLVNEGISKILGRDFAFIALGGATDSSFLEGHSYTYEGSTWGKIVDILLQSKSMNPVIYFDELDKVSDTPKGEEIIGILTHLTDTSQNSKFHDKYFAEVDFDSEPLFVYLQLQ